MKRLIYLSILFSLILGFNSFAGWQQDHNHNNDWYYYFENKETIKGNPKETVNYQADPNNGQYYPELGWWNLPNGNGGRNYFYFEKGYLTTKDNIKGFPVKNGILQKPDGSGPMAVNSSGSKIKVNAAQNFITTVANTRPFYNGIAYTTSVVVPVNSKAGNMKKFNGDCSGFGSACVWKYALDYAKMSANSIESNDVSGENAGRFTCWPDNNYFLTRVGFSQISSGELKPGTILIKTSKGNDGHTIICTNKNSNRYQFTHMASELTGTESFEADIELVSSGIKLKNLGGNCKGLKQNPPEIYNALWYLK